MTIRFPIIVKTSDSFNYLNKVDSNFNATGTAARMVTADAVYLGNVGSNFNARVLYNRKDEAPRDKLNAWLGIIFCFGAVVLFFIASASAEDKLSLSNLANLGQVAEVFGIMFFGLAMGRWRA